MKNILLVPFWVSFAFSANILDLPVPLLGALLDAETCSLLIALPAATVRHLAALPQYNGCLAILQFGNAERALHATTQNCQARYFDALLGLKFMPSLKQTPLGAAILFGAVKSGCISIFRRIFQLKLISPNAQIGPHFRSVAYHVVAKEYGAMLSILIYSGADVSDSELLTLAIRRNNLSILKKLLSTKPDVYGEDGLVFKEAASRNQVEMLEALLQFPNLNQARADIQGAMLDAGFHKSYEAIELLNAFGASIFDAQVGAATSGDVETFQWILAHFPEQQIEPMSLRAAVVSGSSEMTYYLLQRGLNPNMNDWRLLRKAGDADAMDVFCLLLNAGATLTVSEATRILNDAITNDHRRFVLFLMSRKEQTTWLNQYPFDGVVRTDSLPVLSPSMNDHYPLRLALRRRNWDLHEILTELVV